MTTYTAQSAPTHLTLTVPACPECRGTGEKITITYDTRQTSGVSEIFPTRARIVQCQRCVGKGWVAL